MLIPPRKPQETPTTPRAETEMSEEQEVFKFAVTAGLKPGDVVRARTPAGIRVEVTIPPDALPGDIVQFVLPSAAGGSDLGGAGGTTLEEKVDGPTLMAKIKSEEKINVRDVNQAGVSNAAPKITFSITVPLDTKAGQTLVAELPDGQRVVVTVPGSAKLATTNTSVTTSIGTAKRAALRMSSSVSGPPMEAAIQHEMSMKTSARCLRMYQMGYRVKLERKVTAQAAPVPTMI